MPKLAAVGPFPGDLLGPTWARENDEIIPIHVTRRADLSTALCGARTLPHPAAPEAVELGAVRRDGSIVALDEVELEMGTIGNLPRHREAIKIGHPCRDCLERVAKLRDKLARPAKKAAAKVDAAQRRAERAATAETRKTASAEAKATRKRAIRALAKRDKAEAEAKAILYSEDGGDAEDEDEPASMAESALDIQVRGELLAMLRPHAIDAVARLEHATSPAESDAAMVDMRRLKSWMDWLEAAGTGRGMRTS